MKKLFKTILMTAALFAAVAVVDTAQAGAGTGSTPQTFGITNTSITYNTVMTNLLAPFWPGTNVGINGLGTCQAVDLTYNSHGTLILTGTSVATNTTASVAITFNRVDSAGDIETAVGGAVTWQPTIYSAGAAPATPITNTFVLITNLPSSFIGAASKLHVNTLTTSLGCTLQNNNLLNSGSLTNTPIKLLFDEKNCPFPQQ